MKPESSSQMMRKMFSAGTFAAAPLTAAAILGLCAPAQAKPSLAPPGSTSPLNDTANSYTQTNTLYGYCVGSSGDMVLISDVFALSPTANLNLLANSWISNIRGTYRDPAAKGSCSATSQPGKLAAYTVVNRAADNLKRASSDLTRIIHTTWRP